MFKKNQLIFLLLFTFNLAVKSVAVPFKASDEPLFPNAASSGSVQTVQRETPSKAFLDFLKSQASDLTRLNNPGVADGDGLYPFAENLAHLMLVGNNSTPLEQVRLAYYIKTLGTPSDYPISFGHVDSYHLLFITGLKIEGHTSRQENNVKVDIFEFTNRYQSRFSLKFETGPAQSFICGAELIFSTTGFTLESSDKLLNVTREEHETGSNGGTDETVGFHGNAFENTLVAMQIANLVGFEGSIPDQLLTELNFSDLLNENELLHFYSRIGIAIRQFPGISVSQVEINPLDQKIVVQYVVKSSPRNGSETSCELYLQRQIGKNSTRSLSYRQNKGFLFHASNHSWVGIKKYHENVPARRLSILERIADGFRRILSQGEYFIEG